MAKNSITMIVTDEVFPIGSIFNSWLKKRPGMADRIGALFMMDHGRETVSLENEMLVVNLGDVFALLEPASSGNFKVVEFFNKFGKAMKFVKRLMKAEEKKAQVKTAPKDGVDSENAEIDETEISDKSEEVRKEEKRRKVNSDRRKKSKVRKDARKNADFTESPGKVGDVEKAA